MTPSQKCYDSTRIGEPVGDVSMTTLPTNVSVVSTTLCVEFPITTHTWDSLENAEASTSSWPHSRRST